MKPLLFLLVFLLISGGTEAATITGKVYNDNLEPLNNVIVTVNSTPKQLIISKEGEYSFELSLGTYVLNATYADLSAVEFLTIQKEGAYTIDLILFPEEQLDELEEGLRFFEETDEKSSVSFYLWGIVLLVFGILVYNYLKKRKEKAIITVSSYKAVSDDDGEKILLFLEKQGGRATQREIRKEIPVSEAKISLMLTELEENGKIKKIRRGRGNIIVREKDQEQKK